MDMKATAALALYLVLVDAVVEGWRRGSPLRWWLAAAVLVYATTTVLAWRRVSGPHKAVTAAGVFLALAAATVWVPGGILTGAWQRLPELVRLGIGAALMILPVVLLVSTVRAGIPRFREGSPRQALYQVVALGTSLALIVATLPLVAPGRSGEAGTQATTAATLAIVAPIVPSAALSESIENSIRAIEDGDREAPRDRWDPAAVVEHVGKDPQQLFDWVERNTFWIPYRGMLRGPTGVLMDRMGNSFDRALLLATLLRQAGHTVRLARGSLTPERAVSLLPVLVAARFTGLAERQPPLAADAGEVRAVTTEYHLDGPAVERTLAALMTDGERQFSTLDSRTADQTNRLRDAVRVPAAESDRVARVDRAVALLRDHWWVQRQDAGTWSDLDLLAPRQPALTAEQETVALDALPSSEMHQITVRVVSEQWSQGRVAERIVLQHALTPADVVGTPIVVRFWPRRWPAQFPGALNIKTALRTTALAQNEWTASLLVGRQVAERASLLENGDVNEHPAMSEVAQVGGAGTGAADDAASMLRGLGAAQPDRAEQSMLTAAWLEFEIHAPGEAPRTIRRPARPLEAAPAACPIPPCGPGGTVGIGPPRQSPMSKSVGGFTNLGNVLKGGS